MHAYNLVVEMAWEYPEHLLQMPGQNMSLPGHHCHFGARHLQYQQEQIYTHAIG